MPKDRLDDMLAMTTGEGRPLAGLELMRLWTGLHGPLVPGKADLPMDCRGEACQVSVPVRFWGEAELLWP
jgi:hypothetical protein